MNRNDLITKTNKDIMSILKDFKQGDDYYYDIYINDTLGTIIPKIIFVSNSTQEIEDFINMFKKKFKPYEIEVKKDDDCVEIKIRRRYDVEV